MKKTKVASGTAQKWLEDRVSHRGDDCLLFPFSCSTPGYGQLMPRGTGKLAMAHRFICELAHGAPPTPAYHAAHSCGNRRCVNPSHLSWKTASENQLDRKTHGTQTVSGRIKVSLTQVRQIRQLKGVETSIETSSRYGITESNVRLIQDGKIWHETGRKHSMMLSPQQVLMIRRAPLTKSVRELSEETGLSDSKIRKIRSGRTYRHVGP